MGVFERQERSSETIQPSMVINFLEVKGVTPKLDPRVRKRLRRGQVLAFFSRLMSKSAG
jgi:hypothetical protein